MIPFISNLFNLTVTRKEVLERAKKYKNYGLCYAINRALIYYKLTFSTDYDIIKSIFPLFKIDNAYRIAKANPFKDYWWPKGEWNTGRMDFLNWLIEQYKNDKTDLRKV